MKVELYFYDTSYGDYRVFNDVKDVKVVDNGKWCKIEIPAEGETDEVYLFRVDDIRQIHSKKRNEEVV